MKPETLFARQPILNHRGQLYGYELLFRNDGDDRAHITDPDRATANVLVNAFTHPDTLCWLNNTPGLVNIKLSMADQLPAELSKHLIVEILEDDHAHPLIKERVRELKNKGFTIAMDDFRLKDFRPDLIDLIDIVKIDVLNTPPREVDTLLMWLHDFNITLLAEKIEDYATYQRCQEQGFMLFQGYLFAEPETVMGKRPKGSQDSVRRLLSALSQPTIGLEDIECLLATDAALSYQLVQLANSALYHMPHPVTSLRKAIVVLGVERIRNWANWIAIAELGEDPGEMQQLSLARAKLCQSLGKDLGAGQRERLFMLGLFSMLDDWFDEPMNELLSHMPLDTAFKSALQGGNCREGRILQHAREIIGDACDTADQRSIEFSTLIDSPLDDTEREQDDRTLPAPHHIRASA